MIIIGKPAPEALHAKLPAHSVPMLPIRLLRDRREQEQGKTRAPAIVSDVLGMCHTSRKQNGVHLTIKHNSSAPTHLAI